jgi:pyruvate/2-oxoglutarate dehydrogenase complex dihydrolipoamide acyltransferase (E2) component
VIEIRLPSTAWDGAQEGVEALLDKWQVAEKILVTKGQVLATVVLVKASIDIEAPDNGWLENIRVKEGESFADGAVLANFTAS